MYQQLERKEKQAAIQQPQLQRKETPNRTGLPDNLKDGIERLSGFDMSDVRVHYNSSKPAQLNAHAYAQGNQIHLGAGQERHLPHEAWHVVQQKQGRVRPTMTMNGQAINDNVGLEKEADVMGGKALQMREQSTIQKKSFASSVFQLRPFNDDEINTIGGVKKVEYGAELATQETADLLINTVKLSAKNLIEALNLAALRFAFVGKRIKTIMNKKSFANEANQINAYKNNNFNPIVFFVKIPFGNKKTLKLKYQLANKTPGYVIWQKIDGENEASMIADPNDVRTADQYGSKHHDTQNAPLKNLLERDPENSIDYNRSVLDARTKIAGEGARFKVVRNNSSKIADTSRLYTTHIVRKNDLMKETYYSITFSNLWKTWRDWFDSEYDIENEQIKDKLLKNKPKNDIENEKIKDELLKNKTDKSFVQVVTNIYKKGTIVEDHFQKKNVDIEL